MLKSSQFFKQVQNQHPRPTEHAGEGLCECP